MHFVSNLQVDLAIRGNPALYRRYSDVALTGGVPPHGISLSVSAVDNIANVPTAGVTAAAQQLMSSINTARANYYNSYVKQIIESKSPMYRAVTARLVIKTPNVDVEGEFKDSTLLYTDEFFFKGRYSILTAKHLFVDGKFSQELTLIPEDADGGFSRQGSISPGANE
jgi:hypothetical protein